MTRQDLLKQYGHKDARETISVLRQSIHFLQLNMRLLSLTVLCFSFSLLSPLLDLPPFCPVWVSCLFLVLSFAFGVFARFMLRNCTRDLASILGEPGGWTKEEGWEDEWTQA